MKKRLFSTVLALLLLAGCGGRTSPPPLGEPAPSAEPSSRPAAEKLTWVHGFYAGGSYGQIEEAAALDAVSLGWGRLQVTEEGQPWVNTTPSDGNLWVTPDGADTVTDYFREKNIPFNLCVFGISGNNRPFTIDGREHSALEYAMTDPLRGETAAALAQAAAGYSGLTVDFEGLQDQNGARENFPTLLAEIREKLAPGQTLYAAVPADDWYSGYDYRAIGEVCDRVILMAHSYYRTSLPAESLGAPAPDCPPAAIGNVRRSLRRALDRETGVAEEGKLALAVSFDTVALMVDGEGNLLDTALYAPGVVKLARRLKQADAGTGWSDRYQTPWATYRNEEGDQYKVWYEDGRSVEAKIDMALAEGVSGLSLWRIGIVPADDEVPDYNVWTALAAKR